MKKYLVIFFAVLYLNSCGVIDPVSVIDGSYEGTYITTLHYGTDTSLVGKGKISFEFSGGKYKYDTDYILIDGKRIWILPGSLGSFGLSKRKLKFVDIGRHTALYEPSLYLNGDYVYKYDGSKLTLTQNDLDYKYFHELELHKIRTAD